MSDSTITKFGKRLIAVILLYLAFGIYYYLLAFATPQQFFRFENV